MTGEEIPGDSRAKRSDDGGGSLVTVCVPTIGRTEYLQETLRSIAYQRYRNIETIVLDNASPPETRDILREYVERHSEARILRSDYRLPMFTNFNRGVGEASGKYIAFLHDDDRYLPNFLETTVGFLEANPAVPLAASNCDVIDGEGRLIGRRRPATRTQVISRRDFLRRQLAINRSLVLTPGAVYRTDALAQHPFDETLSVHFGDFVVMMRLAELGGVGHIDEYLWQQRVHETATSLSAPLSVEVPRRLAMLEQYADEYASRWPEDAEIVARVRPAILRSVQLGLLWGWVSARDQDEAVACLRQLEIHGRPLVAAALRALQSAGLSSRIRRGVLMPVSRAAGRRFGL